MKILIWLPLLLCGVSHASEVSSRPPEGSALPAGVIELIPEGYEELIHEVGQLTDASNLDYLVVIHRSVDTREQPSPRPLLIVTQRPDGTFRLAARNDSVVMRADDGGQCDPFDGGDGLVIKNRYFTVQNQVSCGNHWTAFITFHYDKSRDDWFFHKEIAKRWIFNDDPDGDALRLDFDEVTKSDRKHPISFEAWRPSKWCDYAEANLHEKDNACDFTSTNPLPPSH
jgi:hypothetical protein